MNDFIKQLSTTMSSANNSDKPSAIKKDTIIEIAEALRRILFPICFECDAAVSSELIEEQLRFVYENLQAQILATLPREDDMQTANLTDRAKCITEAFLSKLPHLKEVLRCDVEAAFDGDPAAKSHEEVVIAYPGLFAISIYRIAHELHLLEVPLLPRIMTEYAHSVTGIDIHPAATIGEYFFIDHGTGVVIGETTTIGNHVKIYQGVTLGARSTRKGQRLKGVKRHPTIGDNVTIYSNTTILGGDVVIGNGATIGGNAFIVSSIAEGAKAAIKLPKLKIKQQSSD